MEFFQNERANLKEALNRLEYLEIAGNRAMANLTFLKKVNEFAPDLDCSDNESIVNAHRGALNKWFDYSFIEQIKSIKTPTKLNVEETL